MSVLVPEPASSPFQRHLWADPSQLSWRPDETVYSLAARHHVLSGNCRASRTSSALFQTQGGRIRHDFPTNLRVLAHRASGALGAAETILRERTIVPAFLPWLGATRGLILSRYCLGTTSASGRSVSGVLSSSTRAFNGLRFCKRCTASDQREFGSPYWHRQHQLPGALICLKHETILDRFNNLSKNRYELTLPPIAGSFGGVPQQGTPQQKALALISVSSLGSMEESQERPVLLRDAYRAAMIRRGVTNARGFTDTSAAIDQLVGLLESLGADSFIALSESVQAMSRELLRLARRPLLPAHPVRHQLLILWLFGAWEEFDRELGRERTSETSSRNAPVCG